MNQLIFVILVMLAMRRDVLAASDSRISDLNFGNMSCVPYAYGDFNADKLVDIFCVSKSQSGYEIQIWLAQENLAGKQLFVLANNRYQLENKQLVIVNIVPGDFNGDAVIDMLVVFKDQNAFKMSLFLGNKRAQNKNDFEKPFTLKYNLNDQPFVADFNGDGSLDILIQQDQYKKFIYIGNDRETQEIILDESNHDFTMFSGYAHSLTDLNNDFIPDFTLTVQKVGQNVYFKQWIMSSTNNPLYNESSIYPAPDGLVVCGQSVFADYDSDGQIEHLLPGCLDEMCAESVIYIYKDSKWNKLDVDFGTFGFIPADLNVDFWNASKINIKVGDYDLNGYLDLLVVLQANNSTKSKQKEQYAILMKNSEAHSNNPTFNRTFKIDNHLNFGLYSYSNVVQASFFDIYEDGYLDILLVVKDADDSYKVVAYKNEYDDDVYFLKVMVIPGTCSTDKCPQQTLPYGMNYPGALIRMETISYDFKPVILYACQLSKSSHMSLQLPYIIFGLGSTPNFIDELKVGILATPIGGHQAPNGFSKEFHQIIPNSQLVINPYPRHLPSQWKMQLFITPSKNILMTAISLGSTMICLVIIIGILQFREKKMDEKERKLESQRFHFDGL